MKCCLFCTCAVLSSVPQLESEPAVEQIGETPEDVSFAIPEKWKWVQLNNVTTQITDGTHHSPVSFSKEDPRGKFLYITAKNIKFTGVDCSTATYVTEDTHKEITSRCLPEYRDVLYIKDGATTGVVTVNNIEEPFSLLSSVALIKPIKLMLDPDFLSFTLRSKSMTDLVRGKMKGTGIPRVTLKILKKFSIPLPPLEEQRRIVAKLNELLPLVEIYGKEQEALEKMEKEFPDKLRASLLQEAIQGKLVPQLESEPAVEQIGKAPEDVPFSIPEKWKWVAIGSVCAYIQRGKSPKYSEIQQIPVVAQKCNQWDGFHIEKAKFIAPETADSYKTDRWLQDKDVLWNSTGLGTLGRVALYKKQLNPYGCAVADSHVTVMRCSSSLLPEYLYYYICSPSVQSVVEEISDGSTKQKELATKTIREFQFPLPPIDEQRRIIAKLTELLNIARQLENSASIP